MAGELSDFEKWVQDQCDLKTSYDPVTKVVTETLTIKSTTGSYVISNPSTLGMIHFTDHYEDWEDSNSNLGQQLCSHEPCENGFRRTWCVRCNVDMESIDGVYVVVVDKAREQKQD